MIDLLISLTIISDVKLEITNSQKAQTSGVKTESSLDLLEHPVVGGALIDDGVHEVLWRIGAEDNQELLQGSSSLISSCLINIVGRNSFLTTTNHSHLGLKDGDALRIVFIVTLPSSIGASWEELDPVLVLPTEGLVVEVPSEETVSGDWGF